MKLGAWTVPMDFRFLFESAVHGSGAHTLLLSQGFVITLDFSFQDFVCRDAFCFLWFDSCWGSFAPGA